MITKNQMLIRFIFSAIVCFLYVGGAEINKGVDIIDEHLNVTEICKECVTEHIENGTKCKEECKCNGTEDVVEAQTEFDLQKLITNSLSKIKTLVEVTEDHDIANDDGMAKRIRLEADRIFRGIIISLILFMTCASVCVITACVYCCRINYQDRKLKSDIKALAKKLKRDFHSRRTIRKEPLPPISESCNVIVEDAGVFVC